VRATANDGSDVFGTLDVIITGQVKGVGIGGLLTADSIEGIPVTYKVLTEDTGAGTGTVQVGNDSFSTPAIAQGAAGTLTIPETVAANGVTYAVKSVGSYAFYYRTALEVAIIPGSVESIGNSAFIGCSSLVSVDIPGSVESIGSNAFARCSFLTAVIVPDSVESLGNSAFFLCSSLVSAVIGDSVESIGSSTFNGCSSLASVTLGSSVASIGNSAFSNCGSLTALTIPASVESLARLSFNGADALITLVFEGGIAPTFEQGTLGYLSAWGTLYYPEGAQSYDEATLRAVGLPAGWRVVAGSGGPDLNSYSIAIDEATPGGMIEASHTEAQIGTTVTLTVTPDAGYRFVPGTLKVNGGIVGLTAAEDGSNFTFAMPGMHLTVTATFVLSGSAGVDGIFTVENADGVPIRYLVLTEQGTAGTVQVGDGNDNRTSSESRAIDASFIGSLVLPDVVEYGGMTYTVAGIGAYAFYNCAGLTSIDIPDSVASVGGNAFYGCSSLASVTLPDAVTSIGMQAFRGCTTFTSFTIPDSVKRIERGTFRDCTSLVSVTLGSSVDTVITDAFNADRVLTSLVFMGDPAPMLEVSPYSSALSGLPSSGTVYYPEGAQGYDPSAFQAAGLGSGWAFTAVPSGPTEPEVGEPGSGDLDGDGKTTTSEALQVARAVISGIGDLTPAQIAAVDMDGDGALTMSDVVRILRVAAGL
jgi:hypothetical protein